MRAKCRYYTGSPPNLYRTEFYNQGWSATGSCSLGVAIVVPDTSPRAMILLMQQKIILVGASFYVDATQEPWREHYQMYTYISKELPQFIAQHFPVDPKRCGIFGHSMGGHER